MCYLQAGLILQMVLFEVGYCQFPFPTPLDCDTIQHEPCLLYGRGTVCGSDGKDYINSCRLAQAVCSNPFIYFVGNDSSANIGYTRPFITTRPTTKTTQETTSQTRTNIPSILTTQALSSSNPLNVICSSIDKVRCANDIEPLCGTDDRTYINYCEFHKEVCQKNDLKVKHIGFC